MQEPAIKQLHRWIVLTLLLLPTTACGGGSDTPGGEDPSSWSFSTQTMGTVATVQLVGRDSTVLAEHAYQALIHFHHADSLLSNWSDDSEISRLNREAGSGWVETGPELMLILRCANRVYQESAGAFDPSVEPLVRAWGFLGGSPRVPTEAEIERARAAMGWDQLRIDIDTRSVQYESPDLRLDLGGIAKGYAVDEVAAQLDAAGLENFLVDLSGNMVVRGAPPSKSVWRIGIRDPRDRLPHLGLLAMSSGALASSGDYEQFVSESGKRYGHILDPRSGYPAEGMAGVTVIAPSAIMADAWATALFVLGIDAARELALERNDLSCVLIERGDDDELIVWIEESLRGNYTPHPELTPGATLRWY